MSVFVPLGPDRYAVRLPGELREVLAALADATVPRLRGGEADDSALFPPAHPDDPEREEAYREMVGDELRDGRIEALELLSRTAGARELTGEEIEGWLHALECLRLLMGPHPDEEETLRAVREGDEPRIRTIMTIEVLGQLQAEVVDALDPERAG